MVCSPMLTNASITKPPVCCFCPLCLTAVPTTNSWQQTNVQICNSKLHNEPRLHHTGKCICTYTGNCICIILASVFAPTLASPYKHSNITFPMQLLTHKVPTSKVVTKVQLELWGHKSYWRLTALEGLLDKRKIMLRKLKMSDIAICFALLRFSSPFLSSPSIEISIWISSVAPPNNVSIPIYCLHLNPTTLVDTRRDAILVNVTDSSNYMNSRRQIWIIAINILNGRQIFAFPRAHQISTIPIRPK